MTYPQQPGNWSDPSWPGQQQYADPNQPASPAGYGAYPTSPAVQGYPTYGYSTPPMVVAAAPTNGLAIAALVCALAGIATCGVTAIVGAIMGHVARKQIRERGEGGDGLALGGIISGWIIFGLYALFWTAYLIFFVWLVQTAVNNPYPYPTPS